MTGPLVVKIGGSLGRGAALEGWMRALLGAQRALAFAPGGGRFADAVRDAQRDLRFCDAAAHDMAILAMEQYALAVADLFPRLEPVTSIAQAQRAHAAGRDSIWLPAAALRLAPDIEKSWDVTSDSLAAWYARRLGARALLLVKSVDLAVAADAGPEEIVDPKLEDFAQDLRVYVAGPAALATAATIIASGGTPGSPLPRAARCKKIAS